MTESPGRVWLGYSRSRIVLLEADGVHPYNLKDGADIGSILTLHAHEGHIFAGGSNGVASFDGSQFRRISLARKEALRGVSGIVFDKLGGLWMNGGTGVVHVTARVT